LSLVFCKKTVARITYTVLVETLNPARSINQCCVLCLLFDYCVFDFSVYYMYLQYFDTVGWAFWPVKTVSHITYTVLAGT